MDGGAGGSGRSEGPGALTPEVREKVGSILGRLMGMDVEGGAGGRQGATRG